MPVTGSLLASQGHSLVWVNPVTAAPLRRLDDVGSNFSDLKVDSSTGLIYGRDGQGTVVVDPATGDDPSEAGACQLIVAFTVPLTTRPTFAVIAVGREGAAGAHVDDVDA